MNDPQVITVREDTGAYVPTPAEQDLILRAAKSVDFRGGIDIIRSDRTDEVALRHALGTELASGEPSRTYEERRTRCYELAGYAVAFGDLKDDHRVRVVHGSMHGPEADQVRIGHAWVELPGDLVWEPILALIRDRAAWVAHARPRDERTYAPTDLLRNIGSTGHFGRWHESRYP